MANIDHANPSPPPSEDAALVILDLKQQPAITVQPVAATPSFTPALTPDSDDVDAEMGKKLFSLSRPDERARELVKELTFEEQVCYYFVGFSSLSKIQICAPVKSSGNVKGRDFQNGQGRNIEPHKPVRGLRLLGKLGVEREVGLSQLPMPHVASWWL